MLVWDSVCARVKKRDMAGRKIHTSYTVVSSPLTQPYIGPTHDLWGLRYRAKLEYHKTNDWTSALQLFTGPGSERTDTKEINAFYLRILKQYAIGMLNTDTYISLITKNQNERLYAQSTVVIFCRVILNFYRPKLCAMRRTFWLVEVSNIVLNLSNSHIFYSIW